MKTKNLFIRRLMVVLIGTFMVLGSSIPAFAKTHRWQPSTWLPSGVVWDSIEVMSDYVTRMSNGRIVMKPSSPGAIVPVKEQLESVSMGVMQACFIYPGYFTGQIPVTFAHGDCMAVPTSIAQLRHLYEEYENGRIMTILREEYAKHGVHLVGNVYRIVDNLMISRKPINGIEDIKNLKFRTSDLIALQLAELGAGTIWTPGDEIYTMLSTGGVDAITFSHAADDVDMGFHEVTKYWVKYPTAIGPAADALIVNLDTWNSLDDDLKAMLEAACEIGTARNKFQAELSIKKAWDFVEKKGIEIVEWSKEDARTLTESARNAVPENYFQDKAFKEVFEITEKWAVEQGYWSKQ